MFRFIKHKDQDVVAYYFTESSIIKGFNKKQKRAKVPTQETIVQDTKFRAT